MKNGSDNWLFLDSFMSLDQSQLFYLYLPSQESMNYKNKGKTTTLCVVAKSRKSQFSVKLHHYRPEDHQERRKNSRTFNILLLLLFPPCWFCHRKLEKNCTLSQLSLLFTTVSFYWVHFGFSQHTYHFNWGISKF